MTETTLMTEAETIRARELAALLSIDLATVYKHVQAGRIPKPEPESRPMFWQRSVLENFDVKAFRRKYVDIPKVETEIPEAPQPPKEAPDPENCHYAFRQLLSYVSRRVSVYLYGPPGTGKSHAAHQAATIEGLRYAYVSLNPQSSGSLLNGFIDAQGRFVNTEFYNCYVKGGVFCIDELDNASPSLLTTLNSAIANGLASFPNGVHERHADFVLIATGNTSGRGGDWQFPERRKIDEATIDRLRFLPWGYDEKLEERLAYKVNPACGPWVEWIRSVRAYIGTKANGIRGGVYPTPRSLYGIADDLANATDVFTAEEIADANVFKGLDPDTKTRILNACPLPA